VTESGQPRGRPLFVVLLTVGFASVAGAIAWGTLRHMSAVHAPLAVPWWALVCGFAAAEVFVIHLERGRQTHTFSLVEIPLVVGLYLASPLQLLSSRLIGAGVTLAVHRRQAPLKLAFNLSLFAAETSVAIVTFRAIAGAHVTIGPASWPATFIACIVANLIGAAAVSCAIAATSGRVTASTIRQLLIETTLLAPVANTSAALCITILLWYEPAGVVLMAAVVAVIVMAYRGYVGLRERYANLTKLYKFNELTQRGGDADASVDALLHAARTVMNTERARLVLLTEERPEAVVIDLDAGQTQAAQRLVARDELGLLWSLTTAAGTGLALSANSGSQAERSTLAELGWRDCLSVVSRRGGAPRWLIAVADRVSNVGSFDREDLVLFNALASHAEVVLDNSELLGRLRHEALHDALTTLPNRALFTRDVESAMRSRGAGEKVAVLLMDLDRFKDVNDTLGHHRGDQLLIEVGRRLRDSAVPGSTVARLGGDEFAVLLPAQDDVEEVRQQAIAIGEILGHGFDVGDLTVEAPASIGIAVAPDHGEDPMTLLQRADIAMYAAKASAQVTLYAPEHDGTSRRHLGLAAELRKAVAEQHLEVWYQPQADAITGEVCGAEALVRWRDPRRGLVAPDDFIPVAEQTGLIGPLAEYVVGQVARQWRTWDEAGMALPLAINVSMRNLHDSAFAERLCDLLRARSMPLDALTVEITESSIMSDSSRALRSISTMAEAGIRISVDDFGTGYSSLTHLRQLPAQEIKVDKGFVTQMTHDDRAIVRAVIALGHNLGLTVVAEGVESLEAWSQLREWGCHKVQGYRLAKPMPAEILTRWLTDRPNPFVESCGVPALPPHS
jgi:diguanylate cyclase (GGDEF)-like protein